MAEETAKPAPIHSDHVRLPLEARSEVVQIIDTLLIFLGDATQLTLQAIGSVLRKGINVWDLLKQMALIGADSIWIVLTITTATGAVFAYYTATLALQLGFTEPVGGTLAYGLFNELGPVLGGVAFAARGGAAIAAEIGSMVVTEQVEALRAMAVSPIQYLVVPRVLAAILMLPLLTIVGNASGLAGGYLFAGVKGISHVAFIDSVLKYTQNLDLIRGLIKSVIFAFLVGIISCQQGLRTEGGATGVGRATTNSVVLCVVSIFVADFFLTQILAQQVTSR